MNAFDFYRLLHQARFNTRLIMGRYRVWWCDGAPITESELRAMWGDR